MEDAKKIYVSNDEPKLFWRHINQRQDMSFIKRLYLLRAHPRKILIDSIALIWAVYFLWLNLWTYALGAILILPSISLALVWKSNPRSLEKTNMGKLVLIHLHPVNFILHLVGIVILTWSVWNHFTTGILTGISVLILGHCWGWKIFKQV